MTDQHYFVDNNVLSRLTTEQRAHTFFQTKCWLPEEVIFEAEGLDDHERLNQRAYRITADVLQVIEEVMASVAPTDRTLVDLYSNRGNADPILIACALHEQRNRPMDFFSPTWAVASDDKGVRDKAEDFEIPVINGDEFLRRLENSPHTDTN